MEFTNWQEGGSWATAVRWAVHLLENIRQALVYHSKKSGRALPQPKLSPLLFRLHSNNCTWAQTSAYPRCLCIGVRFTGRPVPNAAWRGTRTVHGMALSAPDTFPWPRGTECILHIHDYHVATLPLHFISCLTPRTSWRMSSIITEHVLKIWCIWCIWIVEVS